ncbi:MAG: hypothetical protein VW804_04050, partial [Verrucomicrobiota bacterium]
NELGKIKRVMEKVQPGTPHEVLLVLDASTGQNAVNQAVEFSKVTDVTGLITWSDGMQEHFGPLPINQFHTLSKGQGEPVMRD